MDKKLIDSAHEIWAVAQLIPGESIEDGAQRVAEILFRIDAERGKEAVGFASKDMKSAVMKSATGKQPGTPHPHFIVPLFLSPTIPEGMVQRSTVIEECAMLCDALAAKAENAARDGGYYSKEFASAYEFAASNMRAMLAAAQGERNAD